MFCPYNLNVVVVTLVKDSVYLVIDATTMEVVRAS